MKTVTPLTPDQIMRGDGKLPGSKPDKPQPDELREIGTGLSAIQDDLRSNRAVSAFEKITQLKEYIAYLAAAKH